MDQKCLLEFKPPQLPIDLNEGFESYQPKKMNLTQDEERLTQALKKSLSKEQLSKFHFISYRNNFNKIMGTPYKNNDDWQIKINTQPNCQTLFFEMMEKQNIENKGDSLSDGPEAKKQKISFIE